MNNAIVFLVVVLALVGTFLLLKREDWRKRDAYEFIFENLIFLDVGIEDVTYLQTKYFPALPGAAEQLAAARLTHDTIANEVLGQFQSRTLAELEEFCRQLRTAASDVNGLRRFVVNRLTKEQLVAEGLEDD